MSADAVVGHLTDPFRSGVARFNALLADGLGVPVLGLADPAALAARLPLLSAKLSQLDEQAADAALALSHDRPFRLLLHETAPGPLETELVRRADLVLCANAEVERHVRALGGRTQLVFAPAMLGDRRSLPAAELTVFSFGMAHKVRADMFVRLREALDATQRSYALFVSHANHEAASAADEEAVAHQMRAVFPPERLFYLGNLSDVAVFHAIRWTTFFASFFEGGMRANNTSVWAAMQTGAVVITNLDADSPLELEHGRNVLDLDRLDRLPLEPERLDTIAAASRATAAARSWTALIDLVR